MREVEPTDLATLQRAWRIGKEAGLRYVYCGNLPGSGCEGTDCYACGRRLIERDGFTVLRSALQKGRCPHCQASIDGVWQESPRPRTVAASPRQTKEEARP